MRITKCLLLVALGSLAGCPELFSVMQKPTVTVKRVDVTQVSLSGLSANFVLGVDNPNPVGLPVGHLDYQITVDGHALADGHSSQSLSIPGNGSAEVVLPVTIRFVELGQAIDALLRKDVLPYTIRMTVGFDSPAGMIDIPLEQSGSFPVPKLPDVSLGGASVGELGVSGLTLHLDVGLKNPNAFPLPVGALSYRVTVNGVQVASSSTAPRTLAGNASETLPLALRLDFLGSGMAIAGALQSGHATVGFDGELDLAGFRLPIHLTQEVR